MIEDNNLPSTENDDFEAVETSGGMYGFSRRIKTLQRIFTGHVLREFDLNLIKDDDDIINTDVHMLLTSAK